MLATASSDCVVKVLDLSTEKIIHQWHTADRRNNSLLYTQLIEIIIFVLFIEEASSVCFLTY